MAAAALIISFLSFLIAGATFFNSSRNSYRNTLLVFLENQETKCDELLLGLTVEVFHDPSAHWVILASIFERCEDRLRYVRTALSFLTKYNWTMGPEGGNEKENRLTRALRSNVQFCEYIQEIKTDGNVYDENGDPYPIDKNLPLAREIILDCEHSFSTCFHLLRYEIINTNAPFTFLLFHNKGFKGSAE